MGYVEKIRDMLTCRCNEIDINRMSEVYGRDMYNLEEIIDCILSTNGCMLERIVFSSDHFRIIYNDCRCISLEQGLIRTYTGQYQTDLDSVKKDIIDSSVSNISGTHVDLSMDIRMYIDNVWKLYGTAATMYLRFYTSGIHTFELYYNDGYKINTIWNSAQCVKEELGTACDNIVHTIYMFDHQLIKNAIDEF